MVENSAVKNASDRYKADMWDFSPISKFQKYVISDRCKDTTEKSVVCYLKYYRGARGVTKTGIPLN